MIVSESREQEYFDNLDKFLGSHNFLTESESIYETALFPIIHHEYGNVVSIEELCEYASANGITDAGIAINAIAESSKIDPSSIIFSIKDYNYIGNDDYQFIANAFMNEGASVYLVPISSSDPVTQLGELVLETAIETGNMDLLDWFAFDEEAENIGSYGNVTYKKMDDGSYGMVMTHPNTLFDQVAKDYGDIVSTHYKGLKDVKTEDDFNNLKQTTDEALNKLKDNIYIEPGTMHALARDEKAKSQADRDEDIFQRYMENVKQTLEDVQKDFQSEQFPKTWLAKKIAWFRNLYNRFRNANKNLSLSSSKGIVAILKWICAKILGIIDLLARKLQNAVN